MRTAYVVALAVVAVALLAGVCWAGPISAGTAAGKAGAASKSYVRGTHDVASGSAYSGTAKMFNGTLPYSAWPDRARVKGRAPAMASDICVLGSRQRSATATSRGSG